MEDMDFNKLWNALSNGGKVAGIAGIVLLINIFLPWYGFSIGGFSESINAFDSGFLAWGGSLIAIAAAVILLLDELGQSKIAMGNFHGRQIALLVGGLGTLLVLLRWLTETDLVKFGLFLGILGAAAVTAGCYMSMKEAGIAMPSSDDFRSLGGGGDDGPPPPPPPGS
jgi:hypothetical protein